jgi:hypothetical protein
MQQHRNDEEVPKSQCLSDVPGAGSGCSPELRQHVGNVKHLTRSDDRGRREWALQRCRIEGLQHCPSFVGEVVVGIEPDHAPIFSEESTMVRAAEPNSALDDTVEDGLDVRRRAGDHAKYLARRGLLLSSFRLSLQRLRQAVLKIVDLGVLPLRLTGNIGLGFDLRLRGLRALTHRPLLASDTEAADDRLGERV